MYHSLGILFVSFGLACSRDTSKVFRSMPAISNSLVNLGKMDISFHFNRNPGDNSAANFKPESFMQSPSQFYIPRPEPMMQQTVEVERSFEPCPCSSLRDFKNPFSRNNPTEMLTKILKSNDLFSFNQEPVVSTTCCDSHEHVEEDTVFFDFGPKNAHVETQSVHPQMPPFPLMLDAILPKLQSAANSNIKPKAIEIFFFPKNKEGFMDLSRFSPPKDKKLKKSDIQIVGDKDLKNEFKSLKYRPSIPMFGNKENILLSNQRIKMDNKDDQKDMKLKGKQEIIMEEVAKEEVKEKTTPGPFTASPSISMI